MRNLLIKDTDRLCRSQKYVGGKAANLALLLENGYPVPPFFVLTTKVFSRCFKLINKSKKRSTDYEKAQNFLSFMKYGSKNMPSKFWKTFEKYYRSLQSPDSGSKVSVRSSSPLEDQAAQSFAGQFETFLDVEELDTAWQAVKKCWLSMWQPNVLSYQQQSNQKRDYKTMAVIIQKMVHPDISGVLFTRDPLSKNDSEMLIEFSLGAPDDVVSGKVEPQRIRVDKKTAKQFLISSINEKNNGKKLCGKMKKFFLKERIEQLSKKGQRLEIQFNLPLDIEWAIEKNKLWLLQVRPLTAGLENERQRRDKNGDLWTDYFFVERFVEPATPLGWSIVGKWITKRALREPLYYLGFDELLRKKKITRLFDFFPHTRVEVFQSMYSVIPDFAIAKDKQQAFLNLKTRSFWLKETIQRLPFLISRLLLREINWFPPLHLREWQRFLTRYLKQLKRKQTALESMELAELRLWFLQVELLTDEFLSYHRWSITFADLFFHSLEFLVPMLQPELKLFNLVDLISGLPGNKTVEANLELSRLAYFSKNNITKNNKFDVNQLHQIPGFQSQFELFLSRHGHRSQNLDPYYPTWRDDSDFIKRMIIDIIADHKTKAVIEESQSQAKDKRIEAEALLFTNLSKQKSLLGVVLKKLIKHILNMSQSFALLRENQRYYWHMALAEKRRIILQVGKRLVTRKVLTFPEQIFFLQRSEFLHCFTSEVDFFSLRQNAEQRYKKWKQAKSSSEVNNAAKKCDRNESDQLHGFGVSAGKIRAKAKIVYSLVQAQQIKPGKVLVTRSVDPAWTPVFAKAAGLVLEVGGVLSHAAIVAREFRLPAVTSVTRATSLIKDDQLLEIDGSTGIVTIIQE